MIVRNLGPRLTELARSFPVVTLTGPRQSGKTTLCRALFPEHRYRSLEPLDTRAFASSDPRGFLADLGGPAILDEVQRAPGLLSYIQEAVDAAPAPGRFVLTGSANLALLDGVSQSLAGRTAVLELLPCSLDEVRRFPTPPGDLNSTLWTGSYPAIHDRGLPPSEWYRSYALTYLERDVRSILNVGDLGAFQAFLSLAAGRAGQLVNLSQLGADAGVSHNTARAWLSVLETAYVAFRLRPFHVNLTSRVVKASKLYFFDTGLLCSLLGIREPGQLATHPLRGPIFENWVVAEVVKWRVHRGLEAGAFFLRDRKGFEVDLVVDTGAGLVAAEVKSGMTLASDFLHALERLPGRLGPALAGRALARRLVYGGEAPQLRSGIEVVPWSLIADRDWSSPA